MAQFDAFIDFTSVVDKDEEIKKLTSELEKVKSELTRAEKMLSNEAFVNKAPAKLIEAENEKKAKYAEMLEKIENKLKELK